MFKRLIPRTLIPTLTLLGGWIAAPAAAEPTPASDLLLPYFEVDLSGFKRNTPFDGGRQSRYGQQPRLSAQLSPSP
jgi:hypothetical protein